MMIRYDVNRNYYVIGVKPMRKHVILEASETHERLYLTSKNVRNTPERLELRKYSPKLRRPVVFREISR